MGLVGVFTKELDDALLLKEIDIAVHSLKDVPTQPPSGIIQGAVLERANPHDILISSKDASEDEFSLATGSLRRRAFWRNKYPSHSLKELRGNVPTRIQKLETEDIDGIILAKAGIDRLGIEIENYQILEWMTPAPAQGIVGIFCLETNATSLEALSKINHAQTEKCAFVERQLLRTLEGGCTAPIGALAVIEAEEITLKATLLSEDGKHIIHKEKCSSLEEYSELGKRVATQILAQGGKEIMKDLKKEETEMKKVLCLKKLTPPRVKAGLKLELELSGVEVIETLPDFASIEVKQMLAQKNNWVFSSLNSVSAISSVLKSTASIHKHVYCVGTRVANYFEGKVKSIHQVNSVSGLLPMAEDSGENEFAWFHGNKSDLTLAEEFEEKELTLHTLEVYRTELSKPKLDNLEDYDIYAFFSPSGVDSFLAQNYIPEGVQVAAIGTTTAEHLALVVDDQDNTKIENIIVPEAFEYEALLHAIKAKTN